MKEKDVCHYVDSVLYKMEQTGVFLRLFGTQFLSTNELEITADQYSALDAIYCNNDICQRDLSKIILKDRSNTGRILNILEEKKLIERKVETKGKRLVKKIYITETGNQMVEHWSPKLKDAFQVIMEELTEEDFAVLRTILNKLQDSLRNHTTIQI